MGGSSAWAKGDIPLLILDSVAILSGEVTSVHVLVLEMLSVSTNGERASLANLKMTIGSL